MTRFAQLYLNSGYTAEGESVFSQAISYQKFVEMSSWPKGRRSLLLLKGFAIILSKNGKMGVAAETTEALQAASMEQLGSGDEITCWAAARLPAVRETKRRNANNEQRAIVASRGGKLSSMSSGLNSLTSNELGKLPFAASTGDIEGVREALDRLERSYKYKPMLSTALFLASREGHISVVRLLFDHGAEVNARDKAGCTALHGASQQGHVLVVRLLLDHGADVNARGGALRRASCEGHTAVVELLLKHGVDIDIDPKDYGTAISQASYKGHIAVVELLLKHEVDLIIGHRDYGTALIRDALVEASCKGHTAMVELLLRNRADVNIHHRHCGTALLEALYNGHVAAAELLVKYRADTNVCDESHSTALHLASYGGHSSVVEMLLDHGAKVDAQNRYHVTALQIAIRGGHQGLVELLLTKGADVNADYLTQGTALRLAIVDNNLSIGQLLIENGADVNARSSRGTPLQIASSRGCTDYVDLLKVAGARYDDESTTVSTEADCAELG